jgi:wyosine [tRNA(Phe)-imidazoG37] synthetase (radical SAM superfamily)
VSHVFGPVPSRRLGRSLGVDLIPFKACTFDCLYCQLGPTGQTTIEPQDSVNADEVIEELKSKLTSRPDYITLSGSGEPTLYAGIGELIDRIHRMTTIPIAVITNGSLLWKSDVRKALINADLVVPSLDAGDQPAYERVNRPSADVSFSRLVDGLITFRHEYNRQYWLEVLLLAGITDSDAEVAKIAAVAKQIAPDRIQLNTCIRPPADSSARMVDKARLEQLAGMFTPVAEVIADYSHDINESSVRTDMQTILDMLTRRPCSVDDIATGLGVSAQSVVKTMEDLVKSDQVQPVRTDSDLIHYVIKSHLQTP